MTGLALPDAEASSGAEAEAGQPGAEAGADMRLKAEAEDGSDAVAAWSGADPEAEQPAAQRLMGAEAGGPHASPGGLHTVAWEGR